ncbi:ShlB/FhaC/HecB family hemolysin secretion/activation protein [Sphingomonas crocodyli]|uniref:ShlB/FhaC/HecB family hemolysin secretion/activation protein n=1 Tax=Sphingomonas crocodyli TaxID=1979270 RepID=A0A437LWC6_9SPHN|nr:ShlB/FhaC/HecB family hemolysin secretion/activation protein [Sphingomonas crocodyli]RVT89701.1 ShlB/FhaC/HecB family hemolysin secretion/activation protein [Sphingomonas crocodyli]
MTNRFVAGRALANAARAAVILGLATPAMAQVAPPPVAPAGSVPQQDQLDLPKPQSAAPASRATVDSRKVQAAPCPLADSDVLVSISQVEFTGPNGGALPEGFGALLAGIAASPPSGEQKVAVVCEIRDRAAAVLRKEGYVASVQIPPQRIENGQLRLEVVAAHITEVRVRGDAGRYRRTLAARIEKLKALNPLNEHDAERILLLAADVPGLEVQLTLRPAGTEPGAVIGDLTIAARRATVLANVQNYGSHQLGRITMYGRTDLYGLTGLSDVTSIGGQVTGDLQEQRVLQAVHQMGLGNDGITMSLNGTYAWSRPDLGTLDLRAESAIAGIEFNAPIVRSVRKSLFVGAGVDISEQRTRVFGGNNAAGNASSSPLNRDRIRVAFLRLTGIRRTPTLDGGDAFYLAGRLEVRKGLDILGATKMGLQTGGGYLPSRIEGSATAWVVQGDLDAAVQVTPALSFAGSARGQWANDPLLNYDEYSIGNLTIGRGYDPGANSGDRAIGVRGEARVRWFNTPRLRVETFGFYDHVWLWNLDSSAIEDNRKLGSYGGGVRVSLPGMATLDVMYAKPTDPPLLLPGVKKASDRLMLSLTARFNSGGK